jgi:hypothetical protein
MAADAARQIGDRGPRCGALAQETATRLEAKEAGMITAVLIFISAVLILLMIFGPDSTFNRPGRR